MATSRSSAGVQLTRHAKNKCRRYNATMVDVEALLGSPTTSEPRADGTPSAVGTIRGDMFRVVCVIENDATVVITLWKE